MNKREVVGIIISISLTLIFSIILLNWAGQMNEQRLEIQRLRGGLVSLPEYGIPTHQIKGLSYFSVGWFREPYGMYYVSVEIPTDCGNVRFEVRGKDYIKLIQQLQAKAKCLQNQE